MSVSSQSEPRQIASWQTTPVSLTPFFCFSHILCVPYLYVIRLIQVLLVKLHPVYEDGVEWKYAVCNYSLRLSVSGVSSPGSPISQSHLEVSQAALEFHGTASERAA